MSSLERDGVIPDVIDSCAKSANLKVTYGPTVIDGQTIPKLTPTQVQNPPEVTWKADEGALYTLVMTDPDAPSRADPKFREWRHWTVVNIPGMNINAGHLAAVYVGAGPPKGTGYHRYVFLLYKQPSTINVEHVVHIQLTGKGRGGFKVREFAKKHGLGEPIDAVHFEAQWDEYVPKLYEKLG